MASYFSNLLTTTTSRVASIRQNLLASENDGDTLDDTHVCRVLRAYYIDKHRTFPGWLPPDPRAPPAPPTVVETAPASRVGYGYGGGQAAAPRELGSLFGPTPQQQSMQQPQQQVQGGGRPNPYSMRPPQSAVNAPVARPLPSARDGSQQNLGGAKNRLKNRYGGRGGNVEPAPAAAPPAQQKYMPANDGAGDYEDRFKPPENGYGGRRGGGGGEQPFVAATSPWASNESEFGGGGYNQRGAQGGRQAPPGQAAGKYGLPSGPRGYR